MEAVGLTAHGIDICLIGTFPILALTFASSIPEKLASGAGLHRQTSFRHGGHEDESRRGVDAIPDRGRHQKTSIHAICDFPTSLRWRRNRMRRPIGRDVCKHQKKQNSSPEWVMHSLPRCLLACLPAILPCRNLCTLPTYPTYLPTCPARL
ncbi:uncharacterized protein IWZ02DRAFT_100103 [Phyllosticta citriasiana]|uniref:uncharacterized protein n=1 Tax=Phyllosticta citriasiana TaxID=595635 RepID=UPI0030FD9BBB